jgi:hypothetical protein
MQNQRIKRVQESYGEMGKQFGEGDKGCIEAFNEVWIGMV